MDIIPVNDRDLKVYQIQGLHRGSIPFCAGLLVSGNRVVTAAPILRWALGKQWTHVSSECALRHFT